MHALCSLEYALVEVQTLHALPVVLALELAEGEKPSRLTLSRDEAAELAELIAADLHTLVRRRSMALSMSRSWPFEDGGDAHAAGGAD